MLGGDRFWSTKYEEEGMYIEDSYLESFAPCSVTIHKLRLSFLGDRIRSGAMTWNSTLSTTREVVFADVLLAVA